MAKESAGNAVEQVVPLPPNRAERYAAVHYSGFRDIYGSEVFAQGEGDSLDEAIAAMHDDELAMVETLETAAAALTDSAKRFRDG